MFFGPRLNVIGSDSGFSVEILGRTGIRYSEGHKSMFIDSEVLARSGIQIFSTSIKAWDPPDSEDQVSAEKKRET
jgi:hypothetical protein